MPDCLKLLAGFGTASTIHYCLFIADGGGFSLSGKFGIFMDGRVRVKLGSGSLFMSAGIPLKHEVLEAPVRRRSRPCWKKK
jgi:hypothetical protein